MLRKLGNPQWLACLLNTLHQNTIAASELVQRTFKVMQIVAVFLSVSGLSINSANQNCDKRCFYSILTMFLESFWCLLSLVVNEPSCERLKLLLYMVTVVCSATHKRDFCPVNHQSIRFNIISQVLFSMQTGLNHTELNTKYLERSCMKNLTSNKKFMQSTEHYGLSSRPYKFTKGSAKPLKLKFQIGYYDFTEVITLTSVHGSFKLCLLVTQSIL